MSLFKVSEVVDLGIEKEKKRRDFYGQLARQFPDGELNEIFSKLHEWEKEHVVKFEGIRNSVAETETTGSYPQELSDYMDALIDNKLYEDLAPETMAAKITSADIAFNYAIEFEKDAILFFSTLLPMVPADNQPVIEGLVQEEKEHVIYLHGFRKKLG